MQQSTVIQSALKWHSRLAWVGGVALLLFALSGILHPLMSWTGPQAVEFKPPTTQFTAAEINAIPGILKDNNINQVVSAKLVPARRGVLLQVTESQHKPRRYFNPANGAELKNHDPVYAQWLAEYYLGYTNATNQSTSKVITNRFQDEFDNAYPQVNRLLPVYRITFDTPDQRTAYIYTEIGALAGITNNYKTRLQSLFRWLHTWSWLEALDINSMRIMVVGCLVLSVFGMAVTGTCMIFFFKRKTRVHASQKYHRLIALGVWVPLFMFSISGLYHLINGAVTTSQKALVSLPAYQPPLSDLSQAIQFDQQLNKSAFLSASLIQGPNDQLLYRLNQVGQKTTSKQHKQDKPAGHQHDARAQRTNRFKGQPVEGEVIYINALSGAQITLDEQQLAEYFVLQHTQLPAEKIQDISKVTQFGPGYDFRNKRLPVWQVDFATSRKDRYFIENMSGFQVDHSVLSGQLEGLSFSLLHKFNFLTPFIGRFIRDIFMVVILMSAIIMSIFGFWCLARRRNQKRVAIRTKR